MAVQINHEFADTSIDDIEPHPRNPRRGNVDLVQESIEHNGFYGTIVAQRSTGHILAGNHRYLAAKAAGMETVPVAWVDVDDETATRILLADNRTSDVAKYDDDELRQLLEQLAAEAGTLAGTGYDDTALADMTGDSAADIPEDEVPPPPPVPESERGATYRLGEHLVACGDATDTEVYSALLAGDPAGLLITDPPYNVDYVGKTKDALTIDGDAQPEQVFEAFLSAAFEAAIEHAEPGAPAYVFHADSNGAQFRAAFEAAGWDLKQVLVWVKDTFVLGRQDYQWQHEPILYGWKPGAAHPWFGAFNKTTVYGDGPDIAGMRKPELVELLQSIVETSTVIQHERPKRSTEHPTMKPVQLIGRLMANSSRRGDVVLDPFGGSGSTLIACEHLGRRARTIEISPTYVDVIIRRWEAMTGGKAQRES